MPELSSVKQGEKLHIGSILKYFYKSLNGLGPKYIADMLTEYKHNNIIHNKIPCFSRRYIAPNSPSLLLHNNTEVQIIATICNK